MVVTIVPILYPQKYADVGGGSARHGRHPNQMQGPVTDNIGVIRTEQQKANGPDIVLRPHAAGPFVRVPNTHWHHDAFVFPLLFPHGRSTPGWHPKLFLPPGTGTTKRRDMQRERRISPHMFFRWQLSARPMASLRAIAASGDAWPEGTALCLAIDMHGFPAGTQVVARSPVLADWGVMPRSTIVSLCDRVACLIVPNTSLRLRMVPGSLANEHLFRAGRLLQQYIATQAARSDLWRMAWVRSPEGQKALRAEEYGKLAKAVADGVELNRVGTRVVCPSTERGSRRAMAVLFLNAMAMVARFGPPDFFITVTCNPNHPDILASLLPGQHPSDRPDVISRYFALQAIS